nr:50S ribosomal protein L32e [Candidatus Njordarchaeum guaymaensis]
MTEKPKSITRALRIRRMAKSKKPEFVRYESWRYVRLGKPWRKQIGLDNKARLKMKGWEVSPRVGFRGPREARNLHPSGYKEIMVYNLKNLDKVNPKEYAIRISHQVGTRKRMLILGKAEELGLKVLNPISEITLPPSETEITKEEETKKVSKGKEEEKKEQKKEEKKQEEKQEKKQKQEKKTAGKKSPKEKEKRKSDEPEMKKKGR